MELKNIHSVHLVGIKGTGMSGLALVLKALGMRVTGSDAKDSSFLLIEQGYFDRTGITIHDGFDAAQVPEDVDAVIASTAYLTKNPEVQEAKRRKIPVLSYPQIIGMLTQEFRTIAVCGSHGKTTTTNWLAFTVLRNKIPAIAVAGPTSTQVLDLISAPPLNVRGGRGAFILEADEYENKLKHYSPFGVVLTNIELDHPDYFKTDAQYQKVFEQFIKRIPKDGFLIYCADDPACRAVAAKAKCATFGYGMTEHAEYRIHAATHPGPGSPFAIHHQGTAKDVFRINLLGQHNILNAATVALAANQLCLDHDAIQKGLMEFHGAHRRMQRVSLDPLIYDDYGHHPTEIKATIKALREAYPDHTIWAVFHPHTFTRTKKFLKEFGASFGDADHTIVLEIYGSAREEQGTISSRDVVAEINKHNGKVYPNRKGRAQYAATFEDAAKLLKGKLNDKTLLLTIGAGDVWKLHNLIK